MRQVYELAGLSKQAYHQYKARRANETDRTAYYVGLMEEARQMHPRIGLAKIYHLYQPQGIGRVAFEQLGKWAGYSLEAVPKTSWKGRNQAAYPNRLEGQAFNQLNQVWVTDITYYKLRGTYYYISMIMDLYSRKILACHLASSLHAKHNLRLLRKALKNRKLNKPHDLIHHSDKGVQYTCRQYINLLKKQDIAISMCRSVFENTQMERLNGIIKNDYLVPWKPRSFHHLRALLSKAMNHYNDCPHSQLKMRSPNQYERALHDIPLNQRTLLKVFTFKKSNEYKNPNQLSLFKSQLFINHNGQHNLV